MRSFLPLIMVAGCCVSSYGQDVVPTPEPIIAPAIRWPMLPVPLVPLGPPAPMPVMDLSEDRLYIVESDTDFAVVSVPLGIVSITRKNGPWTVFSRFSDGSGDFEERTYAGKCIMLVRPIAKGQVVLVEVSDLVTPDADRVRRTLNVMGPRPPPPVPPNPNPAPKVKNVSLAIVEDVMNRSPETAILMNAVVNWSEFIDAGNDWRAYDLTTGEAKGIKAIDDLNGPSPGLVIYDKATGTMIHRGNLPTTVYEFKTLIGGLTNGG